MTIVKKIKGTIRLLVDGKTGEIVKRNDCDAFGEGLTDEIPYAYAGKRYDAASGLVYFGQRTYDPNIGRWLSRDPLWTINHSNLYQYVFNNPFGYQDPTGQSVGGFLFGIAQIVTGGTLLATGAFLEVASLGSYRICFGLQAQAGLTLITTGLATTTYHAQNINYERSYTGSDRTGYSSSVASRNKEGSVDPSLPKNPDDLLKRPGWKETTHPEARERGHRTFENEKTGEKLRHDEGKVNESGHERHDHYHRPNPDKTSKQDEYLDHNYNPVGRHSDASHLYAPENVWWSK